MRTLTIEASSPESARGFLEALVEFQASLSERDGRSTVRVELRGDDQEIVDLLNTLEDHVTTRASGPALVDFEGHVYTMHPRPMPA